MSPSSPRRPFALALSAACIAGLVGGAVISRERAPVRVASAHCEVLLDARRSEHAPTSGELLIQRLVLLGMPESAAIALAQDAALAPAELKTRLALAGLAGAEAEKAMQLHLALQQGRPIAHVGLEPEAAASEAAWQLTLQGADPDAAAWATEAQDGAVVIDELPVRDEVPSPLIATCKSCPQIDFMLTPSTTRRVHSSSVEGSGCVMYRFNVQAGRMYRFSTCTEDGGSAAFDTLFTTWATQCVPGPSSDDACGTASRIDITPAAAGWLFLRVSSVAGSGAFRLSYQDLGTACRTCPAYDRAITSIPLGGAELADSVPVNGCKTYRFTVQPSRVYRFSTCPAAPGSLDTVLRTYTANCVAGPASDDACLNGGSEVVVTSPTSGYIYVTVSGFGGAGGNYVLRYDDATDECHACPVFQASITAPTYAYRTLPGAVLPGQCYTYRVPLVAGRQYRFSTCPALGGSTDFQSQIEIASPDCSSVSSAAGQCGVGAQILFTAVTTGNHLVTVRDIGGTGGTYGLVAGLYSAACPYGDPPTLVPTLGYQFKQGEIEEAGQVVRYPLQMMANRMYRISLCDAGGFGPGMTARWLDNACTPLPGSLIETGGPGSTVEGDCNPYWVTMQNGPARTIPVEVAGTPGAFSLAYREVTCHEFWVAGADEPFGGAGQTYGMQTIIPGNFMQFRIAVNPTRTYTFSLCAGDGAASASFNSRLEIYSGDNCTPMALTRTICGDDERVLVPAAGQSFLMVRMVDEGGAGGTFRLFARREP